MLFLPILVGVISGGAWCTSSVPLRLILALLSLSGWVFCIVKSSRPSVNSFIIACVTHAIGFSWLYGTIRNFGGFPVAASAAVFVLYVFTASVPHCFIPYVARSISRFVGPMLSVALAWVSVELFPLRLFPWSVGNLTGETPFALISAWGGVPLVTVVLISTITLLINRRYGRAGILALVWFVTSLFLAKTMPFQSNRKIVVGAVQGNISLEKKHDVESFEQNVDTYSRLTTEIGQQQSALDLVVWPESVLTGGVPIDLKEREKLSRVYNIPQSGNILMGAITFASQHEVYNSAIGLFSSGKISAPYHKQILMPFGEYTPFGDTFPWLRRLNNMASEFSAGVDNAPINFENGIKAGTLICYEDIVPGLAEKTTLAGANLLVTISNDAWFGNTAEPYQHNLVSSFRAIEQGRYLVRASNTGLSSVISPWGVTVASIKPYTEGVVTAEAYLLDHSTLYAKIGDSPWRVLSAIIYLITLIAGIKNLWLRKHSS
jgi:apolipoprotein N-acyltransferase